METFTKTWKVISLPKVERSPFNFVFVLRQHTKAFYWFVAENDDTRKDYALTDSSSDALDEQPWEAFLFDEESHLVLHVRVVHLKKTNKINRLKSNLGTGSWGTLSSHLNSGSNQVKRVEDDGGSDSCRNSWNALKQLQRAETWQNFWVYI